MKNNNEALAKELQKEWLSEKEIERMFLAIRDEEEWRLCSPEEIDTSLFSNEKKEVCA